MCHRAHKENIMSERDQARTICKYIVNSEWRAISVWSMASMFVESDYEAIINYFELHMGVGRQ